MTDTSNPWRRSAARVPSVDPESIATRCRREAPGWRSMPASTSWSNGPAFRVGMTRLTVGIGSPVPSAFELADPPPSLVEELDDVQPLLAEGVELSLLAFDLLA